MNAVGLSFYFFLEKGKEIDYIAVHTQLLLKTIISHTTSLIVSAAGNVKRR